MPNAAASVAATPDVVALLPILPVEAESLANKINPADALFGAAVTAVGVAVGLVGDRVVVASGPTTQPISKF